jgi:N-acetylglucosaminyldiphosphoundecaprenol N-acetyl-beta-D-mannosaminyltransferase
LIDITSKIIGGNINQRVHGPQFFSAFTKYSHDVNKGFNYFFLGSTDDVLSKINRRIRNEFPGINVVGTFSPSFGNISDEENDFIVQSINRSSADILWVGMTAPKQEKWIYRHKSKLNVKIFAGIGAAFDIFAGTIKVPPEYIMKGGLYWLYRMAFEPKRLWKRNFVSGPKFLWYVFKQKYGRNLRY